MPRTLIASIRNVSFPTQSEFQGMITGSGAVNSISVHNDQPWMRQLAGPTGYTTSGRTAGILPYGNRSIGSLDHGMLVEPRILPDNFIGYEFELLNGDTIVVTEQSSSLETSFSDRYISGSSGRLFFGKNGFTAYSVFSLDNAGQVTFVPPYTEFPVITGFDTAHVYLVTDNDGSNIYADDLNVVQKVDGYYLLLDRNNADTLEVKLPTLEHSGTIPELQPYIYSSIPDLEFLVGDLVTGRIFTDFIPGKGQIGEPGYEPDKLATNPSRAHAHQALQIGAASTLNDMSPAIPKMLDQFDDNNPRDIVTKQGLRWCNAYGGAVVLMNTFSKEGMPVQSRESRTRINTLLLQYRTWIEKTIRSVTGWPISITSKPSVFGIGRDFPRSIQRGDQGREQFGRPRRGTNTIGVAP